ncbi:MAG: hypothetical protein V3U40_06780 [Candidatus Scalindua sediminis]|jgi:hypothetical protein
MEEDAFKNLLKQYSPRFGEIAIDKGFVTAEQLTEGIAKQAEDGLSNSRYRLIGSILFEHGWITNEQIDIVRCELFERKELPQ